MNGRKSFIVIRDSVISSLGSNCFGFGHFPGTILKISANEIVAKSFPAPSTVRITAIGAYDFGIRFAQLSPGEAQVSTFAALTFAHCSFPTFAVKVPIGLDSAVGIGRKFFFGANGALFELLVSVPLLVDQAPAAPFFFKGGC
jgi:hypothetical protein